jgi:cell division septum initiation protein DivIVA
MAMAGSIEQLLDLLYTEIEEAKSMPLSNDKCVIERDRILDMIDDVKAEMPVAIQRAEDLVANKNDYIASAKREADLIRKQAEEQAKQMLAENEVLNQARQRSAEMMKQAEERSRELKRSANEYCEDVLRRTEEAMAEAHDEVQKHRARFRAAVASISASAAQSASRPIYDAQADEN